MGHKVYFILAFLLACFSSPLVQAFNQERCGRIFPTADDDHPPYFAPMYIFTMFPSTTSYFSSMGPCSMYGDSRSSLRSSFIESSRHSLQVEAARGRGEYLQTLADLSGCPADKHDIFAEVMQKQFTQLFGNNAQDTATLVKGIDSSIRADARLKGVCLSP